MKTQFLFLFLSIPYLFFSQKKYPKDYFRNPLDIPIVLSGTFGELRSNHFHSGLDIKTQGKQGLPVFSTADGYVSRIKVQQFGYGKAIYVTHPNGYTTVNGHLSKFSDTIENYVKAIQYKKKNYETGNIFPKKNAFVVKKGTIIAFSGDTGGSGGPHLHFEIRDTETENVINPMFFGITTPDTITPSLKSLHVYPLSDNARINRQYNGFKIPMKRIKNGKYKADRISASGKIGFGISAFDLQNKAYNKNGIYSLEMLVNGKRFYYHDVSTFSFAESKYLNLLIDYEYYKKYRTKIQRTYKTKANKLSIYKDLVDAGTITVTKGLNYIIEIITKDFNGNKSSVTIPVDGKETNTIFKSKKDTTNFKIYANKFQKFKLKDVTVAFPKHTFYEDVFLDFKVEENIAKVHTPTIPLDKNYTLSFDVSKYTKEEKEQLYIASVAYKNYPIYQYTRKKDSIFYTTTKTLGNYTLLFDNQKPKAKILYFKNNQWISNSKTIQVKISDNGSGIKNWHATLNDQWILMEYNHKKGVLPIILRTKNW